MKNSIELSRLIRCWGKTLPGEVNPNFFHPALYHMIDAGNIACIFMEDNVSPRWKQTLAFVFGSSPNEWVPWAVAIHDIGKVSAVFQRQSKIQAARLLGEGFTFGELLEQHHTLTGQIAFRYAQECSLSVPDKFTNVLAGAIGGHHGFFTHPGEARQSLGKLQRCEPPLWSAMREYAFSALADVFLPIDFSAWPFPENISTSIMSLTGFVILCDWLASNSCSFPLSAATSFDVYLPQSKERAYAAVKTAGFMQPTFSLAGSSFSDLFQNIASPRPVQAAVDDVPDEVLQKPVLIILEAPTGEGKTEAALALAHRISQLRKTDEFYYALPTTATSNQMFFRIQDFLLSTLRLSTRAKLVHSQAFLLDEGPTIIPLANGETDEDYNQSLEWFSSKKKALLAPFGVGTIDQAELGALNVAHNALRLAGLAGKTLILDEVHAYDMYMTTIIERLLCWLSKLGTSVILLSATLPRNRRDALIRAYNTEFFLSNEKSEKYPCLIAVNERELHFSAPKAAQPNREVVVNWLRGSCNDPIKEAAQKAEWIREQLEDRTCLCWITNTVGRAQQLYQAFDAIADPDVLRIIIHSRYPITARGNIEKLLTNYFGPQGQRPNKAVVIGTQVLEQSLDLDFDLLISDLAPVDLLLQRAGRCHRHTWRQVEARNHRHSQPTLYIYCSVKEDGSLELCTDRRVYADYFLRKTWNVLQDYPVIHLPKDYRQLVEKVYNDNQPNEGETLQQAWENLCNEQNKDQEEAQLRLLPKPNPELPFFGSISRLQFKEDEDQAAWLIARTRKGEESVQVIPLYKEDGFAFCDGIAQPLCLDEPVDHTTQIQLLKTGIRLNGTDLCAALRQNYQPLPALFLKSALLKNCLPLWMDGNISIVKGSYSQFVLELDPVLGMKVKRERICK